AHPGRVGAALAADCAELGLDPRAPGATTTNHVRRYGDVIVVRQLGAVEHDRAEAELDRLVDEVQIGGVVEVDGDGHDAGAGHGEGGEADRCQSLVVADGVLGKL